jgi:hypothetical protein
VKKPGPVRISTPQRLPVGVSAADIHLSSCHS